MRKPQREWCPNCETVKIGDYAPHNHSIAGEHTQLHFRSINLWRCNQCAQYIYQRKIGIGHRDDAYFNYLLDSREEYEEKLKNDIEADADQVEKVKRDWLESGSDWKTCRDLPDSYMEKLHRAQKENSILAHEMESDYLKNGFNWDAYK